MDEGVADTACYTHRPLIGKRLGGEAWYIVGSPIRRNPPPYALESTDRIEYPSGRKGATSFQGNSSSLSSNFPGIFIIIQAYLPLKSVESVHLLSLGH